MKALSQRHIPELDGLRGLAICLVFLTHNFGRSIPFAWVGVDLFFVLSGYLITGILLDYKNNANYFTAFFGRRVLRIFPLYFVCLLIFFCIISFFPSNFIYYHSNQLWFWAYLQNWLYSSTGFPNQVYILTHLWSLAVEEQFYMFWPVIVYFTPRSKFLYVALALIGLSIFSRFLTFEFFHWEYRYVSTISRMETLIMGGVISFLIRYNKNYLCYIGNYGTVIGIVGIAIIWSITGNFFHHNYIISRIGYTCVGLLFSGLLVLILSQRFGILSKLFSNKVFLYLGKYSYGIYIFHWPIIFIMNEYITPEVISTYQLPVIVVKLASFSVVTFLSLSFSWLSFHGFEQHFLKLKKHFPYEQQELAPKVLKAN